jgi:Tfp pilus assembly protein PilO
MINERQAFEAMKVFLEEYWNQLGSGNELRLLLSSLNNTSNRTGLPMDIAMWDDWQRICKEVVAERPELA